MSWRTASTTASWRTDPCGGRERAPFITFPSKATATRPPGSAGPGATAAVQPDSAWSNCPGGPSSTIRRIVRS
ncbi:hypothetical protein, partial [Frankia sp. CeD]